MKSLAANPDAASRVLGALRSAATRGVARTSVREIGRLAGIDGDYIYLVLNRLIGAGEIEEVYKRYGAVAYWLPARRRRKPTAQFVLFRDVYTTTVLVPRSTNALVARFQDVLHYIEPEQPTRPNIAATAGWLLREGIRFASRNRVHGLLGAEGAPTDKTVQLHIHTERRAWAELQRWAIVEKVRLAKVVPQMILLGTETCPPLDLADVQRKVGTR